MATSNSPYPQQRLFWKRPPQTMGVLRSLPKLQLALLLIGAVQLGFAENGEIHVVSKDSPLLEVIEHSCPGESNICSPYTIEFQVAKRAEASIALKTPATCTPTGVVMMLVSDTGKILEQAKIKMTTTPGSVNIETRDRLETETTYTVTLVAEGGYEGCTRGHLEAWSGEIYISQVELTCPFGNKM